MTKNSASVPKIIWLLWLQGWDNAPEIVQASKASWLSRNPGWKVWLLDRASLGFFIPSNELNRILSTTMPYEALSDLVRLELLHRYGGVWADATTICSKPLDDWLNQYAQQGFFAFDRPAQDWMISTWFIAAHKGSYIVIRWREAAARYWRDRLQRDNYFWAHHLFGLLYEADIYFKSIWDSVPKISAIHQFHFGPDAPKLFDLPTPAHNEGLISPSVPVFKLTHKLSKPVSNHSLMASICAFARQYQERVIPPLSRRILVTWYGSFAHGTIGDQRSMESLVIHLIGLGHQVFHATDLNVEIPGSLRVDWRTVDPTSFDCVLFVCGPVLKSHVETNKLFSRFSCARMAGVSVSLFNDERNYCNPFNAIFARQGAERTYGDIAILAPLPVRMESLLCNRRLRIGIVLRGQQFEYGTDRCMWAETEVLILRAAWVAIQNVYGEIIAIENHLIRSGISADEIEQHYAECDLIITSRFHGAIESLRLGVPFIAIDQIKGGKKVFELVSKLGWHHVYKFEDIDFNSIVNATCALLKDPMQSELLDARGQAVSLANETLESLSEWIIASY